MKQRIGPRRKQSLGEVVGISFQGFTLANMHRKKYAIWWCKELKKRLKRRKKEGGLSHDKGKQQGGGGGGVP